MTTIQRTETEVTITITPEQFTILMDALVSAGMHGNNMANWFYDKGERTQADAWRENERDTDALLDALWDAEKHETPMTKITIGKAWDLFGEKPANLYHNGKLVIALEFFANPYGDDDDDDDIMPALGDSYYFETADDSDWVGADFELETVQ